MRHPDLKMARHLAALACGSLLGLAACTSEGGAPDSGQPLPGTDAGPVDGSRADATANEDAALADATHDDATPLGDAGFPDAQARDAFALDADYSPTPELQGLETALGQLRTGAAADLTGDGTPDTTRSRGAQGDVQMEQDADGDGTFEWRLTTDGTGGSLLSVDADDDGNPEQELTADVNLTRERAVLTVDTDLDQVPDRRITWVTTATNTDEQLYREEQDSNGDGIWEPVRSSTISKTKFLGDPCMDGFPSSGNDWNPWPWLPGLTIRTGDGGGACSGDQASKTAAAIDCALSKGGLCLANTNSAMNASLNAALNGDTVMPLVLGCGNNCADSLAATKSWRRPWFTDSKMNLNNTFFGLDADGRCNVMLHELLHWAGNEGSSDHNERSGPGSDQVYSCGRYCGRCSDAGHGSPGNSSVDCARCADTAARKEACGAETQFQEADCGGELTGLCHAGLACIAGNCERCGGIVTYDCDGNVLRAAATCCAACPSNCNRSNDLPCGAPPSPTNSCTDGNPPFCP